jgi:hypothetical protein
MEFVVFNCCLMTPARLGIHLVITYRRDVGPRHLPLQFVSGSVLIPESKAAGTGY